MFYTHESDPHFRIFANFAFEVQEKSLTNLFKNLREQRGFLCFNPFPPSVLFHTETSPLFCCAKQVIGFYMKRNTWQKWIKEILEKGTVMEWIKIKRQFSKLFELQNLTSSVVVAGVFGCCYCCVSQNPRSSLIIVLFSASSPSFFC